MVDWSSPVVIGQAFSAAVALTWLCVGLMLYDGVRFLAFDWSIVSGQRKRRWVQLPYFLSKLCYWTYMVTNLIFVLTFSEINCNGFLQGVEMQMGWITVSSSVLLAFRTVCVYSGKTRAAISVLLTVCTLGLLAAWMVGVKDTEAKWAPGTGNPWQEGACAFTNISSQYSIKYLVTIAYDALVMILTVIGVVRMNGGSRIGSILIQQGILYFLATFVINLLVAILTLLQLNPVMSLIGAVPAATVAVMCSTRLYVELANEAAPKAGGVTSSQISSSGTGEKFARFFKRGGQSHTTASGNSDVYAIKPLKYTRQNGSFSEGKSVGSADDLEAQTAKGTVINVVESQTVTSEPMPPYLAGSPFLSRQTDDAEQQAGSLNGHPYSSTSDVKGHFPRLSKS